MAYSSNDSEASSGFIQVRAAPVERRYRGMYEMGDNCFQKPSRKMSEKLASLRENLKMAKKQHETEIAEQKRSHDKEKQKLKQDIFRITKDLNVVNIELESKRMEEKKHARDIQELEIEVQRLEKENQDFMEKMKALEEFHVKAFTQSKENYEGKFDEMQRKMQKYEAKIISLQKRKTEKDDGSAKPPQKNFAMEKRFGKITDDIADVKKGQNQLVEGQDKLVEGQDKLFERQDKMANEFNKKLEELMKMLEVKQQEMPMAKDKIPETAQTSYHQAKHNKEGQPDTLPPLGEKPWKL